MPPERTAPSGLELPCDTAGYRAPKVRDPAQVAVLVALQVAVQVAVKLAVPAACSRAGGCEAGRAAGCAARSELASLAGLGAAGSSAGAALGDMLTWGVDESQPLCLLQSLLTLL